MKGNFIYSSDKESSRTKFKLRKNIPTLQVYMRKIAHFKEQTLTRSDIPRGICAELVCFLVLNFYLIKQIKPVPTLLLFLV
jgi:hypothetical protein